MRIALSRWNRRVAFVLACMGVAATVDAAIWARRPSQNSRPVQRAQPQPGILPVPRVVNVFPTVRIDGVAYRVNVIVTRYLSGVLSDMQTDAVFTPSVTLSLTRVDGRPIVRPIGLPSLQLTQSGTPARTISLTPVLNSQPSNVASWTGSGDDAWANDVQIRAGLAIPTGRGAITLGTFAEYRIVALP